MLEKVFVTLGIGGLIAIIVGLFIVGPIISILAINQLFGTNIAISFWNVLAAMWLHFIVASTTTSKS
jgi:membrane-bound acyltransferase YfiQ involved in biofilm formation